MNAPTTQTALLINAKRDGYDVAVSHPVPKLLTSSDILIKVDMVALNPSDWMHRDGVIPGADVGANAGCDFCGTVCSAPNSTAVLAKYPAGTRVAGWVRGGATKSDNGAFAEYVAAQDHMIWSVPDQFPSAEAAALGGISVTTAAQVMYSRFKMAFPWADSVRGDALLRAGDPVLIWSGASSVGFYAIQLAKLSGLIVYTTASTHNFAMLKALGADFVYDYKSKDVSDRILQASQGNIRFGLDCITDRGTTEQSLRAMSPSKSGKLVTMMSTSEDVESNISRLGRDNIEVEMNRLYTVIRGHGLEPLAKEEEAEHHAAWNAGVAALVQAGKLRVAPIDLRSGGLRQIHQGLEDLKALRVSGKKLVYALS